MNDDIYYLQNDPAWGASPLGTCPETFAQVGCYVTTFANVAIRHHLEASPPYINNYLRDHGLYVNGCEVTDATLQSVYPDLAYQGTYHCESFPCDMTQLDAVSNDYKLIEILVPLAAGGMTTHFLWVVVNDGDASGPLVADPLHGLVRLGAQYTYTPVPNLIQKVIHYQFQEPIPVPTPTPTPTPTPEPTPVPTPTPAPDDDSQLQNQINDLGTQVSKLKTWAANLGYKES